MIVGIKGNFYGNYIELPVSIHVVNPAKNDYPIGFPISKNIDNDGFYVVDGESNIFFIVEGVNPPDFEELFLDGERLKINEDYIIGAGSTRITVLDKTLKHLKQNRDHILTAKFRGNKTVSQPFRIKTIPPDVTEPPVSPSPTPPVTRPRTVAASAQAPQPPVSMPEPAINLPGGTFTDTVGHWAEKYIRKVVQAGLFYGVSETRFDPSGRVTDAMLLTVIWRMDGSPEPKGSGAINGVEAGQWYSKPFSWAVENKLIFPDAGGRYNPGNIVSRSGIVSILYRFTAYRGMDVSGRADLKAFTDANYIPADAYDAFSWAVKTTLIVGRGNNTLAPMASTNRAELTVLIGKLMEFRG